MQTIKCHQKEEVAQLCLKLLACHSDLFTCCKDATNMFSSHSQLKVSKDYYNQYISLCSQPLSQKLHRVFTLQGCHCISCRLAKTIIIYQSLCLATQPKVMKRIHSPSLSLQLGVVLSRYRISMLFDKHISDTLPPLSPFQQQNIIFQCSHTYHPPSPLLLPSSSHRPQWESASTTQNQSRKPLLVLLLKTKSNRIKV